MGLELGAVQRDAKWKKCDSSERKVNKGDASDPEWDLFGVVGRLKKK